jgi:hypothetical protein
VVALLCAATTPIRRVTDVLTGGGVGLPRNGTTGFRGRHRIVEIDRDRHALVLDEAGRVLRNRLVLAADNEPVARVEDWRFAVEPRPTATPGVVSTNFCLGLQARMSVLTAIFRSTPILRRELDLPPLERGEHLRSCPRPRH